MLKIFNNSNSLTEFSFNLGYKTKLTITDRISGRLNKLGLNIEDIKRNNISIDDLTKRELFERRSLWQSARSTIQKIARRNYESSDKPKKCVICGYANHYEVAHIKAVSDFDDNALISEINDISNLVALCPNHHWEYDNDMLDITEYTN